MAEIYHFRKLLTIDEKSVFIDKSSDTTRAYEYQDNERCTECDIEECICHFIRHEMNNNKYVIPILRISFNYQIDNLLSIPTPSVGDPLPFEPMRRDQLIARASKKLKVDLKFGQLGRWITELVSIGIIVCTADDNVSKPINGQRSKIALTEDGFHFCINHFIEGDYARYDKK